MKYSAKKESKEFDLYNKAVLEISEYTQESVEVVRQKHHMGPQTEPRYGLFEKQECLTTESVEQFYKDAKYYLYELPLWNAERARPNYLIRILKPYLRKYNCQKILDFGGGTGDLCLELAAQGYTVSYCDIGAEVSRFAKWRFDRRQLEITMYDSITSLENHQFDSIISFDCFEHIKDLRGLVEKLVRSIRSKGLLISADAFEGGGLHLLENQKYHDIKVFDDLLKSLGLRFVGRMAQYVFYQKF
ncbi:MAG: class I SAM-dependent methyltransferase [Candidatus Omnitrophota bacterium]